jgi:hypothetical protein
MNWIVMAGTVERGFTCYGLFDSPMGAVDWACKYVRPGWGEQWTIMRLFEIGSLKLQVDKEKSGEKTDGPQSKA